MFNINEIIMKMRKLVLAAVAMFVAGIYAAAQPGIEAGYMNMRYNTETGGVSKTGAPLNGFYVGVSDEINIVAGLGVHVGLNYSFVTDKSTKEIISSNFRMDGSESDHYLNVPIRIRYAFNIIPKVLKVQAFAGPVFSVGLSHTSKLDLKAEVAGITMDGSLKYDYYTGKFKSDNFSDEQLSSISSTVAAGTYNRFDVAMGGGLGVELFNFLEFKAGYDWGLVNRIKGDLAENASCKRDMFYFTLGFRF